MHVFLQQARTVDPQLLTWLKGVVKSDIETPRCLRTTEITESEFFLDLGYGEPGGAHGGWVFGNASGAIHFSAAGEGTAETFLQDVPITDLRTALQRTLATESRFRKLQSTIQDSPITLAAIILLLLWFILPLVFIYPW